MDVAASLIGPLTNMLAPALPYLLGAGEKAAGEAGKALGAEAWAQATAAWEKVRPSIEKRPAAREAAEALAANSGDPYAQGAFGFQLRKVLSDQPELAQELQAMVPQAVNVTVTASGSGAVAVGRDNRGPIFTWHWLTDLWKRC